MIRFSLFGYEIILRKKNLRNTGICSGTFKGTVKFEGELVNSDFVDGVHIS